MTIAYIEYKYFRNKRVFIIYNAIWSDNVATNKLKEY